MISTLVLVLLCSSAWIEVSFTIPPYFRIAFLMKLHRPMCYFLSWSMYVNWRKQQQTGRQRNTIRWSWQWATEVLKINYVQFWRFWHCWIMKNISTQLCLKGLYTCSKPPLHSLNMPAVKYPGNRHVHVFVKSKMKPVFTTYLFYCHKSITFLYTLYYSITALWQFSDKKKRVLDISNRQ